MPSWVETKTEIIHFSVNQGNAGKGYYFFKSNFDELNSELDRILSDNYDLHFQIVGCVPLTTGIAHQHAEWKFASNHEQSYAGAGYGYGWGLSNVSGAIVFLQKVEQISQEEFDRRSRSRTRSNRIAKLQAELENLDSELSTCRSRIRNAAWSTSAEIQELPGLKTRYQVGSEKFLFRKKAEETLFEKQATYKAALQKEKSLLDRQMAVMDELEGLEARSLEDVD
ncbi:hypothetical protein [Thalassospira xiamenensis]|uniref:hypothetical protein n=1 Tax=Thalassospira xiamenensis TaxID=220697 RepID=UPI000DEDD9F8|nr:hypothetical protein [Thalassospira xiamenensis]RCK37305.1 hypothetical protein TH24_17200 [Thalassospira xiamenensis]